MISISIDCHISFAEAEKKIPQLQTWDMGGLSYLKELNPGTIDSKSFYLYDWIDASTMEVSFRELDLLFKKITKKS